MKLLKKLITTALAALLLATPVLAVDYSVEFICELPDEIKDMGDFGDDDYNYISPEIGSYNVAAVKFSDAKSYFDYTGYLKIEKGEIIIERGKSEEECTYERFSKNGKYGFRHKQTKEVLVEPIYDEFSSDGYAVTGFTYGDDWTFFYRTGDKWGLMDTCGREVTPAISVWEPQRIENKAYGGYYIFDERIRATDFYEFWVETDGERYAGVVDDTGNILLEPKYCYWVNQISIHPDGRYIFVAEDENWKEAVIDQNGNVIIPYGYECINICYDVIGSRYDGFYYEDTYRCNGLFLKIVPGAEYNNYESKYVLIDSTGKTISAEYTYISPIFKYGMANADYSPGGTFYGYTGYLLNRSGKVVLKKTNYYLEPISETLLIGSDMRYNTEIGYDYLMNINGQILSNWNFVTDDYYHLDGPIFAKDKNDKCYLIDRATGNVVLGPFDECDRPNFGVVATNLGLMDLSGNLLLPKEKGTADILGITEQMPYFTVWNNGTTSIYKLHTSGTAVPSTSTVYVDGEAVQFDVYAVADSSGNLTNYFKIRDLALALSRTKAQFGVSWDGAVNLIPGKSYTATGVEGATPFSGKQNYGAEYAVTKVSGEQRFLDTIILRDSGGNGYTYYKLRDLGYNLGFDVRWDSARGAIVIDTSRPYSG